MQRQRSYHNEQAKLDLVSRKLVGKAEKKIDRIAPAPIESNMAGKALLNDYAGLILIGCK